MDVFVKIARNHWASDWHVQYLVPRCLHQEEESENRKQSESAAVKVRGLQVVGSFFSLCDWFLSKWLLMVRWVQWSSVISGLDQSWWNSPEPALTSSSPPQTNCYITNAQGSSCTGACGVSVCACAAIFNPIPTTKIHDTQIYHVRLW